MLFKAEPDGIKHDIKPLIGGRVSASLSRVKSARSGPASCKGFSFCLERANNV